MKEPAKRRFVCEDCDAVFETGVRLREHLRETGHRNWHDRTGPSDKTPLSKSGFGDALSELTKNLQWEKMMTDGGSSRESLSLTLTSEKRLLFMSTLKSVARNFALDTGVLLPSVAFIEGDESVLSWGDVCLGKVSSDTDKELLQLLKTNAWRFLSIRQVEARLRKLWTDRPELQRAFQDVGLSLSSTVRILRGFLKEGSSLRNFGSVMECLILARSQYSNQDDLIETIREELGLVGVETFQTTNPSPVGDRGVLGEQCRADELLVEVGRHLVPLIDPLAGETLTKRVKSIRLSLVQKFGWVIPGVRFRDNLELGKNTFRILIRDEECHCDEVLLGKWLAVGPVHLLSTIRGVKAKDPTYGMPAVWISPELRDECEQKGCVLFTVESVIAMALTTTIKTHACRLFTYGYFLDGLLPTLKRDSPSLVKFYEASPKLAKTGKKVFCRLLEEGVPVRDQVTILDTLVDFEEDELGPEALTEVVRQRLGGVICQDLLLDSKLFVVRLGPKVVELCLNSLDEETRTLALDDLRARELIASLNEALQGVYEQGLPLLLVTPSALRRPLRDLFYPLVPSLVVLSEDEIPSRFEVVCSGEASLSKVDPPERRPYPLSRPSAPRLFKARKGWLG